MLSGWFGERLEGAYESAKKKGISDQKFAESIGVARAQLRKYLHGEAVPSVRTIALAQRNLGIRVPYDNIEVGQVLAGTRIRTRPALAMQLRLPFSLQGNPRNFDVELKSVRPRKYELRIRMKQVG